MENGTWISAYICSTDMCFEPYKTKRCDHDTKRPQYINTNNEYNNKEFSFDILNKIKCNNVTTDVIKIDKEIEQGR